MMLTNAEIKGILNKTGVLKEGHFLLSSGRHSNQYLQCALALQFPEHASKLGSAVAEKSFKNIKIDVVVAPALGGIIIGYEVARALGVRSIFAERENGKMTLRRGFTVEPGEKVLVVEDVITTGGSAKEVIELLKTMEVELVGVASIIDRSNGNADFDIPFYPLIAMEVESWTPEHCPLCKEGQIPLTKPGSRTFGQFIGNSQSKVLHKKDCNQLANINPKHTELFPLVKDAEGKGYTVCKICNPA